MTAADYPQVMCDYRITTETGSYECTKPVGCDGDHKLVRLVRYGEGAT